MSSPTQRSLEECRRRGWTAQVVERWCAFSRRRIDLFGFIDLIAITPGGLVAIQATSGTNVAHRLEKIRGECRDAAVGLLGCGVPLVVWGWVKKKLKRGGTAFRYELREVVVSRTMLEAFAAAGMPEEVGVE